MFDRKSLKEKQTNKIEYNATNGARFSINESVFWNENV